MPQLRYTSLRYLSFVCWMMVILVCVPLAPAWSAVYPGSASATNPRWATPVDKTFNLYRMQPDLYRSALPGAVQQGELQRLRIATVINFYQRSDAEWLSDPNIRQIHQPLHADRMDDADVLQALRSIRSAQADGAVLIHCKHGQNRTGMIAAMYRIVYQGWSKQQAIDEMREGGFGGRERFEDAERYLQQVDLARFLSALNSGACSTSPWAYCALKEKVLNAFNG
ncbi:dual specificity protein phosphatase family protein [Pseudomonas sp. MM211]|uniref:dual specificity protein phosphatase family protein n=1 Tax=Pseudomonas sp. MM211 TaxID=2866808 RepID=UPI001CEC6A29|nr:dual specificity protein phosphatase family protein [Pseudomonas sp. MM211]UCJ18778.1 dual specificity protein phosphatase family protein [Pseudomonas sp. MM211]